MNEIARPGSRSISVLHSMDLWLSQTMTWLYTQVNALPPDVKSYVVADKTSHLEQFPMASLLSIDKDSVFWKWLGKLSWQIAKRRGDFLLKKQARLADTDILHSHFGDRGWQNIKFAERHGLKHVVTFYGYDAGRLPKHMPEWRERFRSLFASADLFLCEGPYLARTLVELGCPEEKTRVHHLGVPVRQIPFKVRHRESTEPLKVLIAGNFVQKKGIPIAIRALGKVKDDVELRITVIGDSDGQPRSDVEKQEILDAIDECGLADQVALPGYQNYEEFMRQAYEHHVFLSPSLHADDGDSEGGAPISLVEMAATGIQLVSSRHCDIPNVIIDGETGLLADEGNVDQLSEKLLWLAQNPKEWSGLATRARQRIEEEFDSFSQGKKLRALYFSVVRPSD